MPNVSSVMSPVKVTVYVLACAIMMSAPAAHAYIGPGLGAGVIGVILGILGSIFLAFFAVLYYPFKRFLKRRREARNGAPQAQNRG